MRDTSSDQHNWDGLAEVYLAMLRESADSPLRYDASTVKWLDGYIEQVRPQYHDYTGITENIGALLGQIIIVCYGGIWQRDAQGAWGIAFGKRGTIYPFVKVYKQFVNGPEDSIYAFFQTLPMLFTADLGVVTDSIRFTNVFPDKCNECLGIS
jgi:hypothetical protein